MALHSATACFWRGNVALIGQTRNRALEMRTGNLTRVLEMRARKREPILVNYSITYVIPQLIFFALLRFAQEREDN